MEKVQKYSSVFSIEVLRGIAVIFVVFLHGREVCWIGTQKFMRTQDWFSLSSFFVFITQPFVFGSIGVPIFFVISGYCIHRQTAVNINNIKMQDNKYPAILPFLLRRFIRIYPVLIGALIVTYLLDRISLTYYPPNYKLQHLSISSFLVNLGALQGVLGPAFGSNGALWSLSVEIQFYLFYPLLLLIRKRIGIHMTLIVIVLLNSVSCFLFKNTIIFTSYYLSWYLGFYIAEINAASILNMFSQKKTLILASVFIALGCLTFFTHRVYLYFNLWSLGFAFYFWCLLKHQFSRNLLTRMLEFFGEISFSLYAIHLPVFVLFMSYFYNSNQPVSIFPAIGFSIIIVLIAFVFYCLIEKPTVHLLENMRGKLKTSR